MICKYKASIAGNKIFMREYDIDSGMRLFKLHEFLVSDLGFNPDQITLFSTLDANGKVLRRFGFFDLGNGTMDKVSVGDTLAAGEEILRYTYNAGLKLSIILTFCGEAKLDPRADYPLLVAEKGCNPNQFSAVYDDLAEEYDKHSHSHDHDDDDDDDEDFDDEEEMDDDEDGKELIDESELNGENEI